MPEEPQEDEVVLTDVNEIAPTSLSQFIGQKKIVQQLRVAVDAAFADVTSCEHLLLASQPGLGKTQIARIVAAEMGVELKQTLGQTLSNPPRLHAFLLEANFRDVLLVDEADELPSDVQSGLLTLLQDGEIFVNRDKSRKSMRIRIPPSTIIMATNNEFRLIPALRDRVRITCRLELYATDEILAILKQRIAALKWNCSDAVLEQVAQRGRGNPRIALRLLQSCRRVSRAEDSTVVTMANFKRACHLEGLDQRGLNVLERRYLQILHEVQRPIRLHYLATRLGMPPRSCSGIIESYLLSQGLILTSDQGREITQKGIEHLQTAVEDEHREHDHG
jgi:holliday junction DNA helicase RuvB